MHAKQTPVLDHSTCRLGCDKYQQKVKLAISPVHRCGVGNVDVFVNVNVYNITCDRHVRSLAILVPRT